MLAFTSFLIVLQSYRDNGRVIMKSSMQWSSIENVTESSGTQTWNPVIWSQKR